MQGGLFRRRFFPALVLALPLVVFLLSANGGRPEPVKDAESPQPLITCYNPYVIDGDTFSCNHKRIRLAGIDAPELEGHCRPGRHCVSGDPLAAREALYRLTHGQVRCQQLELDSYGRSVATCTANGQDLSCAMVASGHAIRRYRPISCP